MLCIICINSKELGTVCIFHITIINQEVRKKRGLNSQSRGWSIQLYFRDSPGPQSTNNSSKLGYYLFFRTQPSKMRFRFNIYMLSSTFITSHLLSINYALGTVLNSIWINSFTTSATYRIRTRIILILQMRRLEHKEVCKSTQKHAAAKW